MNVAVGGAESVLLINVTNLSRCFKDLKACGVWLVVDSGNTQKSLYDENFSGALALIMGAEGEDICHLTAEQCDYRVKLPMQSQVESLNVSVATDICLYKINRYRNA